MRKIRLVLCRHTRTDDNAQDRYSGQRDVPLNALGEEQAKQLAFKLVHLSKVCAVVTSDLSRTKSVAQCIADQFQLTPFVTPLLREIHVGQMQGLHKDLAEVMFPDIRHRTDSPQFDFRDIGGEHWEEVIDRHRLILQYVLREFGAESILHSTIDHHKLPAVVLVGHGSAFRRVFVQEFRCIDYLHPQGDFQQIVWP